MTYFPLTKAQHEWQERAADIAQRELAPRAADTDQTGQYPAASLEALRHAGLWGLRVAQEHGGLGADLLTTCLIVEELAKHCPSTAMCYKMHLEAAEILCRIPTPYQVEHFVKPMAQGQVFTTIAGSESWGEGDNWSTSQHASHVTPVDGGYQIDGVRKSYVTSAGHATHYQFRCLIGAETPQSQASLLLIERDHIDWQVLEPWHGLGMRGNNSSPMRFSGFVPGENRLGPEHTVQHLTTSFNRPVIALTYAAAYLGIGSGAYELACQDITHRFPSGARRLDNVIYQRRMAEMSAQLEAARALTHPIPFDYALWTEILGAIVTPAGKVDYEILARRREHLTRFVAQLAVASPDTTPERFPTPEHALAYWIRVLEPGRRERAGTGGEEGEA